MSILAARSMTDIDRFLHSLALLNPNPLYTRLTFTVNFKMAAVLIHIHHFINCVCSNIQIIY